MSAHSIIPDLCKRPHDIVYHEPGFLSNFQARLTNSAMSTNDPRSAFIEAACVMRFGGHGEGTLELAQIILAAHPELASADVHTAAILGDDAAVRRFIEHDPAAATAKGGPHGWDALTHLCFSRYLRLDPERSAGFVRAATALLDAGANANTGWYEQNHQPDPEWESVLYGAAGVAHHAGLTRLLLDAVPIPTTRKPPIIRRKGTITIP